MKKTLKSLLLFGLCLPALAFAAKAKRDKPADATPEAKFAAIDKDGDGSIGEAEFVAGEKDRIGEEAAKKRFAELDKNKDGKLSKEEFAGGATEAKKRGKKKKAAN